MANGVDDEDARRSDDGRWIVVDGRRWRATDPAIPEAFRRELVDELMSARREVAGRAAPRTRRPSAPHALACRRRRSPGERGEPWWEEPGEEWPDARLRATVLTLAVHRAPDRTICPSDAARAAGGAHWRSLMEPTRAVVRDLARAGRVEVLQRGEALDPDGAWRGPVRIRSVPPTDRTGSTLRPWTRRNRRKTPPKKGASKATAVPPKPKKQTPKSKAEVDQWPASGRGTAPGATTRPCAWLRHPVPGSSR